MFKNRGTVRVSDRLMVVMLTLNCELTGQLYRGGFKSRRLILRHAAGRVNDDAFRLGGGGFCFFQAAHEVCSPKLLHVSVKRDPPPRQRPHFLNTPTARGLKGS